MAFITLWRHGVVHCMLVLNDDQISIRLLEGDSLLQDIVVKSTDAGLIIAKIWELDESHASWHDNAVA
jgi:hypothetical protein